MKKTLRRTFSLCLALVLALSLTAPAAAASVPVTGVTLDRTEAVLLPGETIALTATIQPENATIRKLSWRSNRTKVATVDENGVVTAKAAGTADVRVSTADGGYQAICKVTVEEEDYVTGLTIDPAGPETLTVGERRQLSAAVIYAHAADPGENVIWRSDNTQVATVSEQGMVKAVAGGSANITATSEEKGKDGTPVSQVYAVTVTAEEPAEPTNPQGDAVLKLEQERDSYQGGQYQTVTLPAPKVTVLSGETDVTEAYTLTYRWTDGAGERISGKETCVPTLNALGTETFTCTVTAASQEEDQTLTGSCTYAVEVLRGTVVSGAITLHDGASTLDKLLDPVSSLSVVEQLIMGKDEELTPAIPYLTDVVFLLDQTSGEGGVLSAEPQQTYSVDGEAAGAKLADVIFTPTVAGTYIIPFYAHGEETWYGLLEIIVSGQGTAPSPGTEPIPAAMSCDSSGLTFTGSDFFRGGDADPIAAVTFGAPDNGKLLRNCAYGSGIPSGDARYYTDSAKDGDYHISTLTYLPPAGFSGRAVIPVTYTSRSGKITEASLEIDVTHKTASDVFFDVLPSNTGSWSADAVDFAYDNGLVNGVDASHFSPEQIMNRAMLVTILYRAAGSPAMTVTTRFTDVTAGSYYYNAVVWAAAMGVVNGTSATTFEPEAPVTRQVLATILFRYADLRNNLYEVTPGSLNRFVDRGLVREFAETGMTWAVNEKIITGTSEATLSPDDPATRAQVVVMLHRYLTNP